MVVKDGWDPRPAAQTAKRHFLNWLETSSKPCLCLPFCTASFQLACCVLQLAFVLHLLRFPTSFRLAQLGSKDRVAGLKQHGSEGPIGPAASSPDCQTSLSELTRNSSKPVLRCQLPTCLLRLACGQQPRLPNVTFWNRQETSSKPSICLPSCTASCHFACVLLQPAFLLHSSGQSTLPQGQSTMAILPLASCPSCPPFSDAFPLLSIYIYSYTHTYIYK